MKHATNEANHSIFNGYHSLIHIIIYRIYAYQFGLTPHDYNQHSIIRYEYESSLFFSNGSWNM